MNFAPKTPSRRRPILVDLTPLIDVTFQLLIFFLLTSSYVSPINDKRASIELDLPKANAKKESASYDGFRISVAKDGQIYTDDAQAVRLEELQVRLLEVKRKQPKTIVLISGDRAAAYGRVARILELVQTIGLPASVDYETGP